MIIRLVALQDGCICARLPGPSTASGPDSACLPFRALDGLNEIRLTAAVEALREAPSFFDFYRRLRFRFVSRPGL